MTTDPPPMHRGITAADLPGRPDEKVLKFALFKRNKLKLPNSCNGLEGEALKAEFAKFRERQSRNSNTRNHER